MKNYYTTLTRAALTLLLMFALFIQSNAQNDAIMQAFYWNVPVDKANLNGTWWDNLSSKADELKNAGITGIWIPAPSKGNWGIEDMGYGIYDHYDLGSYNQKGTVETRFGSRQELDNMISAMHNTNGGKPRINVYADAVLNHVYSSDENEEINPAVKGYVFDEAYRNGTHYVPYPTNEIKWVIPNAQGHYWIKIKGYEIKEDVDNNGTVTHYQGYDANFSWTDTYPSAGSYWESEPNNGGGQSNDVNNSGDTFSARIGSGTDHNDIDEYHIYVPTTHNLVIKLTAKREPAWGTWEWMWSNQNNGYYPFEIWHDGVNIANTELQARTNTNVTYVNHNGTGEANYEWNYTHFHPVDENDFLTGWDWYGQDAIIPNTKGFGNDFNTYSPTVQTRLNDWGYWMADEVGFDGFRLDFVRGYQPEFISSWINNLPLLDGNQRFIVGEYWGVDYQIKNWVASLAAEGADADAFDFPLKSTLTTMCNGDANFNMSWLNHAGMIRNNSGNELSGTSVVTWLDNHDTGKEHDKWVTKDWHMGYAYILTHEGRPCIFYPHYFGVTMVDNHDSNIQVNVPTWLKNNINELLFVRKTYLGGGLEVLTEVGNPWPSSNTYDVYVARRDGNACKDGAIVCINNAYEEKGVWVTVNATGMSNWSNTTLKNAITGETTTVYSDGRAYIKAPSRGYAIYVLATDYVPYSAPQPAAPLAIDSNKPQVEALSIYPNPVNKQANISFVSHVPGNAKVEIFDVTGRLIQSTKQMVLVDQNNLVSWNTGQAKSGLYYCVVNVNGSLSKKSFVVQ